MRRSAHCEPFTMSRHALPPEARASHAVGVKLTPPEWELLHSESLKQGIAPAHLVRDLAMQALRLLQEPKPAAVPPEPVPAPAPVHRAGPTWIDDTAISTWYSVSELIESKPNYVHGDRVDIDIEGNGSSVSGNIVGFVSKNLADYWIVKLDKGIYSEQYPYSCAAVVHTMLKLK